jgi:hypothetical protein
MEAARLSVSSWNGTNGTLANADGIVSLGLSQSKVLFGPMVPWGRNDSRMAMWVFPIELSK